MNAIRQAGRALTSPSVMSSAMMSRLLAFNLLPSIHLHASRHAQYGMEGPLPEGLPERMRRVWHKYRSAEILASMGLSASWVSDTATPALALAMLPPAALQRVAVHLGAMRYAEPLRTTISGRAVRQLAQVLDSDVLAYVRQRPVSALALVRPQLTENVCLMSDGFKVLCAAFEPGGPGLARRAELKLPLGSAAEPDEVSADVALHAANEALMHLEPAWYSFFRPAH